MKGLRAYLREKRQDDFVDNLCRKLLSYALGRGLVLSDSQTLQEMRRRLEADGYAFGSLVEVIVTSPQFLNKKGAMIFAGSRRFAKYTRRVQARYLQCMILHANTVMAPSENGA